MGEDHLGGGGGGQPWGGGERSDRVAAGLGVPGPAGRVGVATGQLEQTGGRYGGRGGVPWRVRNARGVEVPVGIRSAGMWARYQSLARRAMSRKRVSLVSR